MTVKLKANWNGTGSLSVGTVVAFTVNPDGSITGMKTDKPTSVRTWGRFEYPSSLLASENIASIVRQGVGVYLVTFTAPFALTSAGSGKGAYAVAVTHANLGAPGNVETSAMTATSCVLTFVKSIAFTGDGRTLVDPDWFSITVTGNMA